MEMGVAGVWHLFPKSLQVRKGVLRSTRKASEDVLTCDVTSWLGDQALQKWGAAKWYKQEEQPVQRS